MKQKKSDLKKAIQTLGIPDEASPAEIRKLYKELIFQWHPDRCREDVQTCKEKLQELQDAYKIILYYCENYRISFRDDDLRGFTDKKDALGLWLERFGDDPVWG